MWRGISQLRSRLHARLSFETLESRQHLSVSPSSAYGLTDAIAPSSASAFQLLQHTRLLVGDGSQADGGSVLFRPDRLIVSFNQAADTTGGSSGQHSVLNPANWRLESDSIDLSSLITSIEFSGDFTATVSLSTSLGPGSYAVTVRDRIHDLAGMPLDGDRNQQPGGNVLDAFSVSHMVATGQIETLWRGNISPNSLATGKNGNYVVVGLLPPLSTAAAQDVPHGLVAQLFTWYGAPIGDPIRISDKSKITNVSVAMNESGEFVVCWTELLELEQRTAVFAQRFDSDGTQKHQPVRIALGTSELQYNPQRHYVGGQDVAIDAAGNFVVAWSDTQTVSLYGDIKIAGFSSDGAQLWDTQLLGEGVSASLAINSLGHLAASWVGPSMLDPSQVHLPFQTSINRVYLQMFDPDGRRSGDLQQVDSGGINPAVDVAIDAQGNAVIAWQHSNPNSVFARRFDAQGNPQGERIEVVGATHNSPRYTGPCNNLHIALDAYGNFAVSWTQWESFPSLSPSLVTITPIDDDTVTVDRTDAAATTDAYTYVSPDLLWLAQMFDAGGRRYGETFEISQVADNIGATSIAISEYGNLVAVWSVATPNWPVINSTAWPSGYESRVLSRQLNAKYGLELDLNGLAPGSDYAVPYLPIDDAVSIVDQGAVIQGFGTSWLSALIISIEKSLRGDSLSFDTTGTRIVGFYTGGILSLEGIDTLANYEKVLRTVKFSSSAERQPGDQVLLDFGAWNRGYISRPKQSIVHYYEPGMSTIVGQQVFYNHSALDGNDLAADVFDDAAIATDKSPLFAGQTATLANYTSYHRGINGIMIDIEGGHGAITASDFQFRVGNTNNSHVWSLAPEPLAVVVRRGAGKNGSDRVTVVWADFSIMNTWLEVTVIANGNTGLADNNRFYFGNAVGETGNNVGNAQVNATDYLATLNFILITGGAAGIDNRYDFNRDGAVNAQDFVLCLHQILTTHHTVNLIAPPSPSISNSRGLVMSTPTTVYWDLPQLIVGMIESAAPAAISDVPSKVPTPVPQSSTTSTPYWATHADDEADDEESDDWLDALLPTSDE